MMIITNNSYVVDQSLWKKTRKREAGTITINDLLKDQNGFGSETVVSLYLAEKGVGLSKAYHCIDELFEDLNA